MLTFAVNVTVTEKCAHNNDKVWVSVS